MSIFEYNKEEEEKRNFGKRSMKLAKKVAFEILHVIYWNLTYCL